jgi:hypothetical protein
MTGGPERYVLSVRPRKTRLRAIAAVAGGEAIFSAGVARHATP